MPKIAMSDPQRPPLPIGPPNEPIGIIEIGDFHLRPVPQQLDMLPGKIIPPVGARPPDLTAPDCQVTHQHRLRQRPRYLEIGAQFLFFGTAIPRLTCLDPSVVMARNIGAGYA